METLVCGGFEFFSEFDSANLGKVEYVPPNESVVIPANNTGKSVVPEIPDVEFNIWTKPDCLGTEFENTNRTWFYFGIRGNAPTLLVKLNMVDINRQAKMYSQGMAPVHKIVPGKHAWERIRDKPTYTIEENIFILSFKYRIPENIQSITYFAFTYPYSYVDLQNNLAIIDNRFFTTEVHAKDDIYYVRECLCYSLEGRQVDLITISSYHNISAERETRLKDLFPNQNVPRPFRFIDKKVIFISARVHPGETPSSFVFNGFLNLLLNREDPVASMLRKLYVFKLIPFLNPDGVSNGHYRTDTRGINLNRVYLNPSITLHPTIYAARSLIRYYHFGYEKEDQVFDGCELPNEDDDGDCSVDDGNQAVKNNDNKLSKKVSHMTLEEQKKNQSGKKSDQWCCKWKDRCRNCGIPVENSSSTEIIGNVCEHGDYNANDSGLFLYLDMHGHASKKGIFMYGNHFEDLEKNVECMLLPKIMSINNHNFHFTACNFTERNMYLKDRRDGMSREGSGRVAVLKLTGLIRSYTLECNYNTGRFVNVLPSTIKESNSKFVHTLPIPPKYTPPIFEEVGRALGASMLDLTGQNPLTRLPNSEFHSLTGLRDRLRIHVANVMGEVRTTPARFKLRNSASLHAQGKSMRPVMIKARSTKGGGKRITPKPVRPTTVPVDRKENVAFQATDSFLPRPSCSNASSGNIPVSRKRPTSNIRSKLKKDGMLRAKASPVGEKSAKQVNHVVRSMQNAGCLLKQKLKIDLTSKLQTIKENPKMNRSESQNDSDRVKLREICFIKDSEGKKVIAKYGTNDSDDEIIDDKLIVSWDAANNNPQVFTQKNKIPTHIQGYRPINEAGPSSGKYSAFRVHNFSKTSSSKSKRVKRPLRRLTSATDSPTKIEKLKKRKVIKKI